MLEDNQNDGHNLTDDESVGAKKNYFMKNLQTSQLTKFIPIEQVKLTEGPTRLYGSLDIREFFDTQLKRLSRSTFVAGQGRSVAVLLLAWDMGYGKTTVVVDYYRQFHSGLYNWKLIAIVHRRKLAAELAQKFNTSCYLDLNGVIKTSVAITINSLLRTDFTPNILFIDEIEGVLTSLTSRSDSMSYQLMQNLYLKLIELIRTTNTVVIADANMGELTGLLLKQSGNTHNAIISMSPRNEFDWNFVGMHKTHHELIIHNIQNGLNLAVACMSKHQGELLVESLQRVGIPDDEIVFLYAGADVIDDFIQNQSQDKYRVRCFIYSPVIDAGVSIDIKDWFHHVHLYCNQSNDANTAMQMIGRVRNPITNQVFFSGSRRRNWMVERLNYVQINHGYKLRHTFFEQFLKVFVPDYERVETTDPRYLEFIKHYEYVSINRGKGWVAEWIIRNYDVTDRSQEYRQQFVPKRVVNFDVSLSDLNNQWQEWVIQGCPLEEYQELLERKVALTTMEKAFIEHHVIQEFYGFEGFESDEARELVSSDRYKTIRKKVRLFARVLVGLVEGGQTVLVRDDIQQQLKQNYLNHDNYAGLVFIIMGFLGMLNINLLEEEQTTIISIQNLKEPRNWALENANLLQAFSFPIPSDNPSYTVKWFKSVMQLIGMDIVKFNKQRRSNKRRIREYKIDEEKLQHMRRLSEAEFFRIMKGMDDE